MKNSIGFALLLTLIMFLGGSALASSDVQSLVLPPPDPELQRSLERVLQKPPFQKLVERHRLSVFLVDLSNPGTLRCAGVDYDVMRYAASLPKIAILLAVFDQINKDHVTYTPQLRKTMERMIRQSSNKAATELIRLVGFEAIAEVLRDPRYELYDPGRQGGLWVGKDYGGGLGRWKRDPMHNISHGATARQVARFLVMMEGGLLVDERTSQQIKEILARPAINHKFVRGLREQYPESKIYRKSGTWKQWHSDAALVEREGKKYVAVALSETRTKGILSRLIVELDALIFDSAQSPSEP